MHTNERVGSQAPPHTSASSSTSLPPSSHLVASTLDELLAHHNLRVFCGDLHNHTSYSDGRGTPRDALGQLRARCLDFAAITDHGENLAPLEGEERGDDFDKWHAVAEATGDATSETFLAMRGFEWSSDVQGHVCVWSSADFTNWYLTGDETMREFYEWLLAAEAVGGGRVLANFNHPVLQANHFDDFAFAPRLDHVIVTAECFNRSHDHSAGYFRLLDEGWHVGATGASDHHGSEWGSPDLPRTGLFARALTLDEWQNALFERRTFATRAPALRLLLTANGELMGARLTLSNGESLTLEVWCDERIDPHASAPTSDRQSTPTHGKISRRTDATLLTAESQTRVELLTNGGVLLASTAYTSLQNFTWRHAVEPRAADQEHWFVTRVAHAGRAVAYSSPIWVQWT